LSFISLHATAIACLPGTNYRSYVCPTWCQILVPIEAHSR